MAFKGSYKAFFHSLPYIFGPQIKVYECTPFRICLTLFCFLACFAFSIVGVLSVLQLLGLSLSPSRT